MSTTVQPVAKPSAVRHVIATDLDDPDINWYLEGATHEIAAHTDISGLSDGHRARLEAYMAAYDIRATKDRPLANASRPSVGLDYQGNALDNLRTKIRDLDPTEGDELVPEPGVTRSTASHVGSARPHSEDDVRDWTTADNDDHHDHHHHE